MKKITRALPWLGALVIVALASLVVGRSLLWRPAREGDARATPFWGAAPQGPNAELERAVQLEMQGKLDAAVASYGAVLARDPKSWMALIGRANCLTSLKRYDEAIADL